MLKRSLAGTVTGEGSLLLKQNVDLPDNAFSGEYQVADVMERTAPEGNHLVVLETEIIRLGTNSLLT